jgi:hypothetical protein
MAWNDMIPLVGAMMALSTYIDHDMHFAWSNQR